MVGYFKRDRIRIPVFALVLMGILMDTTGCGTGREAVNPDHVEVYNQDMICEVHEPEKDQYEASLFTQNCAMRDIFMDIKARHVGDIVTIQVVETSSASNNANTNTSRNSSLSMQLSNLLGLENNSRFPAGSGFDPFGSITGSTSNAFSGTGTTNRSGNLSATITARVVEVFSNGNMKIMGRRDITINNEKQFIILTGIIRSRDISEENVILSTYIADANITYSGAGILNDRQNAGWLARVLDTVWPF